MMHVDPDLQLLCEECGCEVLYEIEFTGRLVLTSNGPVVRFPVLQNRRWVYRSAPLLEGDMDITCPHCHHSIFLSDVVNDLGPANRKK